MKTKFKDLLLYTLACVGAVSLLISAIDKPKENSQNVGKYQVADSKFENQANIVVLNTETGVMKTYYWVGAGWEENPLFPSIRFTH